MQPRKKCRMAPPPPLKLAPPLTPETGTHIVYIISPPSCEAVAAGGPSGSFFPLALLPEPPEDLASSIDHLDVVQLLDLLEYVLQASHSPAELHEVTRVASTCLVGTFSLPFRADSPGPQPFPPPRTADIPSTPTFTLPSAVTTSGPPPTGHAELKRGLCITA
ncbi:hypothetical protein JCM3770_002857 [Rhodotorula araucariae]